MKEEQKIVMISGCLLGLKCRFDGTAKEKTMIVSILEGYKLVPFCPETLGGLTAPRSLAEIQNGDGVMVLAGKARVLDREGRDVTAKFIHGAEATLRIVNELKPEFVVLKAKSPSCGVGLIYDGSFLGELKAGDGVTTALLRQTGVRVFTENEVAQADFEKRVY